MPAYATERRKIFSVGHLCYVPLTRGLVAVLDVADMPLVVGKTWRTQTNGKNTYATRSITVDGKECVEFMHRVILGIEGDSFVDHIDGNGLNNRSANLRPADAGSNNWNQRLSSANTSGVKGVTFRADRGGVYSAQIRFEGRLIFLGHFKSLESAEAAYAAASEQYHGEYGRTARRRA